jgi:hypothetical protein
MKMGPMTSSTLSVEIRRDHVWILHQLRQVARRGNPELSEIRAIINVLGAHHLAEEETLYEPIKFLRNTSVDCAQQYHIVLDNLTHSIEQGGHSDNVKRCQILLLENLLEHHFSAEEQLLLPAFNGNFSATDRLVFGHEYRRRVNRYAEMLGRRALHRRSSRLAVVPASS